MDVSYSSDEENLNVESSDDLDSEVESFYWQWKRARIYGAGNF